MVDNPAGDMVEYKSKKEQGATPKELKMTVVEIESGINRVTGAEMHLCKFADGTPCLMINGINVKTGKRAVELYNYLLKK